MVFSLSLILAQIEQREREGFLTSREASEAKKYLMALNRKVKQRMDAKKKKK